MILNAKKKQVHLCLIH